jgi:hypothetical protein
MMMSSERVEKGLEKKSEGRARDFENFGNERFLRKEDKQLGKGVRNEEGRPGERSGCGEDEIMKHMEILNESFSRDIESLREKTKKVNGSVNVNEDAWQDIEMERLEVANLLKQVIRKADGDSPKKQEKFSSQGNIFKTESDSEMYPNQQSTALEAEREKQKILKNIEELENAIMSSQQNSLQIALGHKNNQNSMNSAKNQSEAQNMSNFMSFKDEHLATHSQASDSRQAPSRSSQASRSSNYHQTRSNHQNSIFSQKSSIYEENPQTTLKPPTNHTQNMFTSKQNSQNHSRASLSKSKKNPLINFQKASRASNAQTHHNDSQMEVGLLSALNRLKNMNEAREFDEINFENDGIETLKRMLHNNQSSKRSLEPSQGFDSQAESSERYDEIREKKMLDLLGKNEFSEYYDICQGYKKYEGEEEEANSVELRGIFTRIGEKQSRLFGNERDRGEEMEMREDSETESSGGRVGRLERDGSRRSMEKSVNFVISVPSE